MLDGHTYLRIVLHLFIELEFTVGSSQSGFLLKEVGIERDIIPMASTEGEPKIETRRHFRFTYPSLRDRYSPPG